MIDFFSRLDKYMIFKGLNDNKLTVETGISNGLIGKARKRGSLSQDNISKILQKYSDLDANWLFTGEGSMQKSSSKKSVIEDNTNYKELAEARLELIEFLKEKVSKLNNDVIELTSTKKNPILYGYVAEPAPELISKKHK
jgi:hypothetical protein